MKRMLVMTLVLLFAAIPLQADDKKKDDAKSDQKLILGKWKLVERHRDGKVQKEFDRELVMTISKGEMSVKIGDREIKVTLECRVPVRRHVDGPARGLQGKNGGASSERIFLPSRGLLLRQHCRRLHR